MPQTVTISPPNAALRVGETVQLSSPGAKWSSQQPFIASVNSAGLVLGLTVGTATIIAKKGNATATAKVVVAAAAPIPIPPEPIPIPPLPIPPEPTPIPPSDSAFGPQSTIGCA